MSEAFKEQRPLLCEDFSEEEHFAEYPRRYRPLVYKGRARNSAKGATAIITRWPEHWSSSLTYWWIGLSMMALTIFIVYNSIIAFVLLPAAHLKPMRARMNKIDSSVTPSHLPEVYFHIFTNTNDEANLNKYLPYIEKLSDKHMDYNFNVIVIKNKTSDEASLSAEENNEIAFNSLWTKETFYRPKIVTRKNIKIRQVVLSHYLDESPLQKNWRHLPYQFMEFLVKTIAVWDKGGIAVNPVILTPRSPNAIYAEKLETILQKYKKSKENKPSENKMRKSFNKHNDKYKKNVNNIRDIIEILEHDSSLNYPQDNLTEAEDNNVPLISHSGRKLLSTVVTSTKNSTKTDLIVHPSKILTHMKNNESEFMDEYSKSNVKILDTDDVVENANSSLRDSPKTNQTSTLSLLPLFLEFLFHDKPKINSPKPDEHDIVDKSSGRYRKSSILLEKIKRTTANTSSTLSNRTDIKAKEQYKPMIISAKSILPDDFLVGNEDNELEAKSENSNELTIDLKGNLIATKTSCHAFIGTIFSNVIHHTEESLQDFIIAELSLFCKGLLSSCRGIDVILL